MTVGACVTHAAIEDRRVADPSRGLMPRVAATLAYRAIRNTLAFLGHVAEEPPPAVDKYEALRIREVIDRADPADAFAREWASFDALASGELIAHRHDGTPLTASAAGRILFPDVGARPGNEWYYLAETIPSI